MTYDSFLAELGKAGLTVSAFAELIGMNRNSVSNYARQGKIPRHLAVIATLLAEMSIQHVAFFPAIARIDLAPKKPRGGAKFGRFGGDPQVQLELVS
jgi:sugar phosphate isomerase/epimerase